jgi:PAS domain S-box-containing protein
MDYEANLSTALLKNIQAGIVLIDSSTKLIVDANPAACIILGTLKENLIGTHCFDWFCSDVSKCPILGTEDGVPLIDIDNEETQVKRPDGSYVYLLRTAVSFFISDRRHILLTLTDITRQKDTENKYSDLFKYAPAGIYEIDLMARKFTSVNDLMLEYTGYTREEFLNLSPLDLLEPEGRQLFMDRLQKMLHNEEVSPEVEYRIITKQGTNYWISLHIRYLRDEFNVPIKAFCIATDVTARKQARIDLIASKNEAQMYLDMAFNMFVSLDMEGKIRLINKTGCDILGIDECFLLGQDWFNFIPEEDKQKTRELFLKLINGEYDGTVTNFENYVINTRGEKRLIAWKNRVMRDARNNITGTFSSGDDVTDQREAEKKVEEMWNKVDAELTEKLVELKSSAATLPYPFGIKRFELMESLDNLAKGRL